eukprot:scaffold219383_cov27-Tisochrysis_lutea.AAC.1
MRCGRWAATSCSGRAPRARGAPAPSMAGPSPLPRPSASAVSSAAVATQSPQAQRGGAPSQSRTPPSLCRRDRATSRLAGSRGRALAAASCIAWRASTDSKRSTERARACDTFGGGYGGGGGGLVGLNLGALASDDPASCSGVELRSDSAMATRNCSSSERELSATAAGRLLLPPTPTPVGSSCRSAGGGAGGGSHASIGIKFSSSTERMSGSSATPSISTRYLWRSVPMTVPLRVLNSWLQVSEETATRRPTRSVASATPAAAASLPAERARVGAGGEMEGEEGG